MKKSVMVEVDQTTKSILELLEARMKKGAEASYLEMKEDTRKRLNSLSADLMGSILNIGSTVTKETGNLEERIEDLLEDLDDKLSDSLEKIKLEQLDEVKEITEKVKVDQLECSKTFFLAEKDEIMGGIQQNILQASEKQVRETEKLFQSHHQEVVSKMDNMLEQQLVQVEKVSGAITKALECFVKVPSQMEQEMENFFTQFLRKVGDHQQEVEVKIQRQFTDIKEQASEDRGTMKHFIQEVLDGNGKEVEKLGDLIQHMGVTLTTKVTEELYAVRSAFLKEMDVRSELKVVEVRLIAMERDLQWANLPFYKKWFKKKGDL